MAELMFHNENMTMNPYQDPMGWDLHDGLTKFLDKFHQPTVPGHTLITDPDFQVFLWFHDAMGNLIHCPYTTSGYQPKMSTAYVDFGKANPKFNDGVPIAGGSSNDTLDSRCIDLTPFVQEGTLPEIAPAGATKIKTLFGET